MKHFSLTITMIVIFNSFVFPQTGTIKISKPKPVTKDTIIERRKKYAFLPEVSTNYTFKRNNRFGYNAGISLSQRQRNNFHFYSVGILYSVEEQYYQLSANNQQETREIQRSNSHSEFLKVPLRIGANLIFGNLRSKLGSFYLELGLLPEYLLSTKDASRQLSYSDFKSYNLSGSVSAGTRAWKHYRLLFTYSKDFFENLKDRNLYDSNGSYLGKQKSKTNLLSFSLIYGF